MSINDILDDDMTIPIFLSVGLIFAVIIIITAIIVGIVVSVKQKNADNIIYGDNEYGQISVERGVKFLARRNSPHPLNQTVMVYMVVFELSDGERIEFAIRDQVIFDCMVEGDIGTLKYQGKRFIGFKRDCIK